MKSNLVAIPSGAHSQSRARPLSPRVSRRRTRSPRASMRSPSPPARLSENLQDTPIAITAITGAALEERQVFSTDVLDQVVPNLQFANNAAARRQQPLRRRCSFAASARPTRPRPSIRAWACTSTTSTSATPSGGTMDAARRRLRPGAARPAGHAVRPQHHRRRHPHVHRRSGRRIRRHGARRASATTTCSTASSRLDVPFSETLKTRFVARHPPAGRLRDAAQMAPTLAIPTRSPP